MSAQSQTPLFSQSAELVENRKLLKNIILLQNFARPGFCKTRYTEGKPDGVGCGREVHFCEFRGRRTKCLDPDGSVHKCPPEVKP